MAEKDHVLIWRAIHELGIDVPVMAATVENGQVTLSLYGGRVVVWAGTSSARAGTSPAPTDNAGDGDGAVVEDGGAEDGGAEDGEASSRAGTSSALTGTSAVPGQGQALPQPARSQQAPAKAKARKAK